MAVTKIKKDGKPAKNKLTVVILTAGCGSRIKSYEPRSLLKIKNNTTLLEHQIQTINNALDNPEIIVVVGHYANKIIKKIQGVRIVENQLYNSTNSSESLRLAFNNTNNENLLFIHGDLFFDEKIFDVDFSESFVIIDNKSHMRSEEVGCTLINNKLSIMSYGLPTKWVQIGYVQGREYNMLNGLFQKYETPHKKQLLFELINTTINCGGVFKCHESKAKKIVEIDRIKDLKDI